MRIRLLAVQPRSLNYLDMYEVSVADNYEEAKIMIEEAEKKGQPFEHLDLPVRDIRRFWDFVDWMEKRHWRYPFSIFGYSNTFQFIRIRDESRRRGFSFLD